VKPDKRFLRQPKSFWANVRTLGQHIGYVVRGKNQIKTATVQEMRDALSELGLNPDAVGTDHEPTTLGVALREYFSYRASVLETFVEPRLMDVKEAKRLFLDMRRTIRPTCPIPLNKQKGKKKAPAFLTGMVNMLVEQNARGMPCDYDPRELTTVTRNGAPLRTLARRVDGAFPSAVNPIAVWEIKEYYYTTTFGSRVADGVYETLLDGMEIEELREHEGIDVRHYLVIDAHYTWWECGRSYLCRIIDMLHMGYVDEVIFGREVTERIPALVREWAEIAKNRP
jgi:hypothetical protein